MHFPHMLQNIESMLHPRFAKVALKLWLLAALVFLMSVQCRLGTVRSAADAEVPQSESYKRYQAIVARILFLLIINDLNTNYYHIIN